MEQLLNKVRTWGAPGAALAFVLYWMQPYLGIFGSVRTDLWPIPAILFLTLAIASAVRWPLLSVALVAVLLVLQALRIVSPMTSVMWQVYIGSFIALAFTLWTARYRIQLAAIGMNILFAFVMAFIIVSRQYGGGGNWFRVTDLPRDTMVSFWWQCFSVLIVIAAACAMAGICLRLFQERRGLFRATQEARASLKQTEIDLIIEQERSRITRDLHDVLAHSLAVIAAQADGTRYLHPDQPAAALTALTNISKAARNALVDVQHVIDNGQGMAVQPQLGDIESLIRQMQQAGMDVQYRETGSAADLSSGQQLAIFRVLQECLTNALKHGGSESAANIHLTWWDSGLALEASSKLQKSAKTSNYDVSERVGRGLPGMRERARLMGGWLDHDQDEERFIVTAFIPYGSTQVTDEGFVGGDLEKPVETGVPGVLTSQVPSPADVRGKIAIDHE